MTRKNLFATIVSDLFLASLFLYLAGMCADLFSPGIISRALNLSLVLVVCIAAGIFSILLGPPQEEQQKQSSVFLWVYCVALSIAGGFMIWQALVPFSPHAVLFGLAGASIVFFTCFAMMNGNHDG